MADPNAPADPNPFDQIDPTGGGASASASVAAPSPTAAANPFDSFGPTPVGQSSAFGAFARQAGQAVLPTVGGLPAAAAGAELGALAGAPLGPVGAGVLGFAGGAAGYIGGASAISGAQSWALKQLPQSWQDKLGTTDRQANVDAQQHPVASFLGGVAPYALTMSPMAPFKAGAALADNATAFQRVMANPITSRLFGGAAMGGMQLGQEEVDGQKPDWTQVAIATGMGMVFNRPNALGERLTNWGAAPFRTPLTPSAAAAGESTPETEQQPPNFGEGWQVNPDVDHSQIGVGTQIVHTNTLSGTPESGAVTAVDPYGPEYPGYSFYTGQPNAGGFEGFTPRDKVTGTLERVGTPPPTIAQANDLQVIGPGITDAVFQGTHVQNPDAKNAAQAVRQTEMSLTEPPPQPDLNDLARRMHPDLFDQYDGLKQHADGLRQWLGEYAAPPDDQIATAQAAADYAAGRLQDAGKVKPGQYAALKAASDQAQAALDELINRRDAFAAGQGQDNEEAAQVRVHLAAVDAQMRDVGPQVAAAYQRAADAAGHAGVAPEAPAVDEPPVPPGMTRLYHGSATHGRYDGPAWFSTNRAYAENYRGKSAELQYVDYPTAKVNENLDPDNYGQTVERGFTWNAELDSAETGLRRSLTQTKTSTVADEAASSTMPLTGVAKPVEEQRKAIAADIARQARKAGRPAEEAKAAGELYAARIVTRASRFKGALGTPEELYAREGAVIRDGNGKPEKIMPAKAKRPTKTKTPTEQWDDFDRAKTGVTTDTGLAVPGDMVKAPDGEEMLAANEAEGDTQVLVAKPDEAGRSEVFVHAPDEGTLEPLGDVNFEAVASAVRGDEPEPIVVPLPEKADAADAETIKRSSAPEPEPEAEVAKEIAETSPPVIVAKPEPVTEAKDAYADKWFGTKAKAEAFIEKKGIADTHEVIQTAAGNRDRFEILPIGEVDKMNKRSRLAGEKRRAEIAAARAAGVEPPVIDRKGREWRPVGQNAAGQEITEDQRGVRSMVSDGMRSIEPVTIDPRGGISVNRDIHPEYATVENPKETVNKSPDGAIQRQPGEAIRGGTSRVPEAIEPALPKEPDPIRGPRDASAFDGGGRGPDVRDDHVSGQPDQGNAGNGVPGKEPQVTKPPSVGAGDGEERSDIPAAAGTRSARVSIEERSRSNYRITDADKIGQGGSREKIKANIDAIRVLKNIEDEARDATSEEKAVLVKYTGWGAFAQKMFAAYDKDFKDERAAFRAFVTDEEYQAASASTLNAHYTSPDVVKGMWDALAHLGYDGGLAIEPSCGSGNFIGMIPNGLAERTAWTGVELDPLTGRIAKALYGGAEINIQGFQTLKRPSNYYDLAISNVPFGKYNLREKPYGAYPIHDFFFVKSLDKVRPGGVVSFITSRFTMDKLDPAMRRELEKTSDLVGAIRLLGGNKGAFAGNAGTAVTTDIIFLRKKIPGEAPFPGAKWTDTKEIQTPEGPAVINEYFADHPDMMLGEMRLIRGMYSENEPTLVGEAEGLREKIAAAAQKMQAGALTERLAPPPPPLETSGVQGNAKEGGFFVEGGKLFRRMEGIGVPHPASAPDTDRITRLVGMRDIVNDLLKTQLDGGDNAAEQAEHLREKLRTAYDAFVEKHGPINKEVRTVTSRLNKQGEPIVTSRTPNLTEFKVDPDAYKVAAIERYDAESDTATRATIQTKDVISPPTTRDINSPSDALAAVLDIKGRVDLQTVGEMLGAKTEDEVISRLGDSVFQNPNGRQSEPADQYLSGDVVGKLEEARALAATEPTYLRNVAALEKVQPTQLEPNEITAQLGAPWVPADDYAAFLKDIGARNPTVRRVPGTAEWKIDSDGYSQAAAARFGADRTSIKDIVDAAMNNRTLTVYDHHQDGTRTVNGPATEQARVKINELKEAFTGDQDAGIDSWVWKDPDRSERLAAIYNRTFNNVVQRKFDGSHQTFPGMSAELSLRGHQSDAVWRTVQNGNTLLAHVVGAGKTFTMITSGMEQRRLGLIKKPMYVVPNHMLEQFSREFLQAYPDAKILVAQKDEMTRDTRRAFASKAASNDWDGIVITHDAFGRLNMNRDFRANYMREQIDALERSRKAEAEESGAKSPTVKELEKARKVLEGRLDKLLNEDAKDQGTTFEETGADFLFVDEAHKFKNLSFVTRMQRVKGLSQGNSQRAEDLFLKMRYLEQKRPGRSAVFATGTPVSNTMAELWTMMRYLELDKLKAAGLDNFDAWASTFGKVVNNTELSADGRTFKDVSSFSKFVNVPELISLYSEIADTRTADMLNLPRPEVKTESGAPGVDIVQAEPSAEEEAYINELVKMAEAMKGKPPRKGEPNMLSVVGLGRKVATDGRLVDPARFGFNPNGKIALATAKIAKIYHEGKEPGLAQMVFLDLGVPSNRTGAAKPATLDEDGEVINPAQEEKPLTNLYADLKERLIAEGIPGNQIAFIHDAGDDEKKAKLFAKVRSGEVRVIIGSSEKMGVGTNVQKRLIAMHHLDAPWRPADVEQRDGRIVRQGNLNKTVRIYRYVTKRSFDAFMWQKLDTKSKFIGQVLSGAKGSRSAEDVDNPLPEAAEMKAAASGDPRIMEQADLSRQVRQLQAQKRAFETTVSRATWELKSAKTLVANYENSYADAKADGDKVQDLSGDKFNVKLGNQTYDSRTDAGAKVIGAVLARDKSDFYRPLDLKVGEMSGFEMRLEIQKKWSGTDDFLAARASLVGKSRYSGVSEFVINQETSPVALMRNFERLLSQIANQPRQIEQGMASERQNIEKLSQTLQATWPRQKEYATAQKKLADLNADMARPIEKPGAPGGPEILSDEPETTEKEYEQSARAKIRIADNQRPILTLFRDANASSIFHEFGHDFLEQAKRDAAHPAAPDQIRADYQTLRNWLGIKGDITRKQHERFATTWERYLREGVAPSPALAGIFAKFKQWLTSIYQSVKSIGEPISEDVRAVFDRMLTTEPRRTVIADERPTPPSLADIHEADEAETAPHEKEPLADRVIAEYSRYAAEQPPKVANELATAEAVTAPTAPGTDAGAEAGAGPGGPSEVGADRGEPGAERASGAGGKDGGQERRGGGEAVSGSAAAPAGQVSRNASGSQIPSPGPTELLPGPDGRFVDLAGNIRLDNLTDREGVAQAIRESAERNNDFIGDRRGVITDGMVSDLADAIGMDATKLGRRKLGEAFNAEQIIAARKLLIQSATIVADAMKKAATGTDEDLLAYAEARDRHQMIQAQVAGITAEAGRALRAFRDIKGQEQAMNVDQFVKSATGRTLFQLREEAKLGSALETPEQVSKFTADQMKRSFGKMVLEYWINGLISGPATHTTYMIGNMLLAIQKAVPETTAAAAIGAVRSKFGRSGERVLPGEVGAQLKGMAKGFAPAVKAAADALRTGTTTMLPGENVNPSTPFQPGDYAPSGRLELRTTPQEAAAAVFGLFRGMNDGLISAAALLRAGGVEGAPLLGLRYHPTGYIPDVAFKGVSVLPLGTAARLPSRMVAAIHSFFRATNYSTDIGAESYRKAVSEGASDIAARLAELRQNPDPETMARSVQKSNDLTLMGQGGAFVQGLQKITSIEVAGFPVLKFVDPFVNIAANIMDQSIVQRTPAGLFSQSVRDDLMGRNGNVAADTAAAKMLVGTAMSLTFGGLAAAGYASGSGPSDPAKAAMWRLAGNQAHSIRVGNIWYQVNRLGPMGMLMGIAADLQGIAGQTEKGQLSEAGAALVHAFAQNILDESFMRGPADLIQAVENSDQYGPQYVRNFLSSFVPYSVGMAQMARAMDPYQRRARSITDAVMQKIPGMSESLLPRRDIWGQPMPSGDALISPGVTAIYMSKISTDPVNIAMEQLGIAPAPVERRIRAVALNPQQYDDYARIAGVMTKQNLDRIVRSSNWQTWPTGTRYEVINATIDQCREAARGVMLMKYPQIAVQAAQMKIAKAQGQPYTGGQQ